MTQLLRWSVLAAAALSLAGCSKSLHDPGEKFYLVAANIKLQYWQTAASGFYAGARAMHVAAEMVGPDTYDPAAESAAFRDAVAKKPAGILVSAADPNILKGDIDSAIASGTPVITMDADSPASKRLYFIGTNNYEAGRLGAQALVAHVKSSATVVVYTMPTQLNLADRLKGYRDVLADHPGIKITQIVDIKGDPRVAFDTTNTMVNAKGKTIPDAFVCLEASSCQEIADVLDRNSVKGKTIIAMDTNDDTLNWLKKGGITATIAQKPYTMGLIGIHRLDDVHHNKPASLDHDWKDDTLSPFPSFVDTGATLIDSSNLAAFQAAQQSAKQTNSAQ
ncbi:MAG TPA: substrate-binding domain-containing protein [Bryobacteraceae bacterium]|nr:substrate-binding domain-containing protein [Bryobacteraceae bacterium]